MKLGILFMFLVYYSLLGIFFYFASPFISDDYISTVEMGGITFDNQSSYRTVEVFYEDFNLNYGGASDWNLNNWSLETDDAIYCKNDDNDDCIESPSSIDANITYKFDVDLIDCLEDSIFISGHIVDKSLGYGDGDLYLLVSDDSGVSYSKYLISEGQKIGDWDIELSNQYLINNLKFGFETYNMGSGNYYLDEIKVNCNIESAIGEVEVDTDINIGSFFMFLSFGIGLPSDTPVWFQIIFSVWQSMLLIFFVALLYQAIRGS